MATTAPASEVVGAKKSSKQRSLKMIKSLDPDDDERTAISKKISWLLRHGAKPAGLKMNDEGWVAMDDLANAEILDGIDMDTLMQVIINSNGIKLRYGLEDTAQGQFIKAYSKRERKAREMLAPSMAQGDKSSGADKFPSQNAPAFVPQASLAASPAGPSSASAATGMNFNMSPMASLGYPWPGFGFPPMMPFMPGPFMGWPQIPPGKYSGRIKSFNSEKGFGFIECPQTYAQYSRDVFLHKAHIGDLSVGAMVTFACEVNKQGMPQAKDVAPIGGSANMSPTGGKIGDGGKGKGKFKMGKGADKGSGKMDSSWKGDSKGGGKKGGKGGFEKGGKTGADKGGEKGGKGGKGGGKKGGGRDGSKEGGKKNKGQGKGPAEEGQTKGPVEPGNQDSE